MLSDYLPDDSTLRNIQNPSLAGFLQPVIANLPIITGILSFFIILLAGFRYVSSAGNAEQTQQAANTLTYALIGLGLSVLAFLITRILFGLFVADNLF